MRQTSAPRPHWLKLQLLLLSVAACGIVASPVSSPEIASNSVKANNANGASSPNANQQPRNNPQDTHLNSLNAYATNYDSIPANHFKPSYKLPEMESNFVPLQGGSIIGGGGPQPPQPPPGHSMPLLMGYLPQHEGGGVQYLQLVPTGQFIMPNYPYLAGAQPQAAGFQQPLAAGNGYADYAARPTPLLTAVPGNNVAAPAAGPLLEVPYGLPTYANGVQPYRSGFRVNREIKDKQQPGGMNLNLHEYIPGPNAPAHPVYIRGRP